MLLHGQSTSTPHRPAASACHLTVVACTTARSPPRPRPVISRSPFRTAPPSM
ncbi:hypothetical protein MicB006_4130 [Micromonospora sp. B006]|nr:hypothetical protein MicB006_4130 [Micromonospora sp. B006]